MSCVVQSPIALRGRGKRRALREDQEAQVAAMYADPEVKVDDIAAHFGVCRKTVYNILARMAQAQSEGPPGDTGRA